jgi:hypothetical protein
MEKHFVLEMLKEAKGKLLTSRFFGERKKVFWNVWRAKGQG